MMMNMTMIMVTLKLQTSGRYNILSYPLEYCSYVNHIFIHKIADNEERGVVQLMKQMRLLIILGRVKGGA